MRPPASAGSSVTIASRNPDTAEMIRAMSPFFAIPCVFSNSASVAPTTHLHPRHPSRRPHRRLRLRRRHADRRPSFDDAVAPAFLAKTLAHLLGGAETRVLPCVTP